jgi:hypothetical protein
LAVQWPLFFDLQTRIAEFWPEAPVWFESVDAVVACCYLLAAALFFLDGVRVLAPRVLILLGFFGLTLLAKTMGAGLTYASTEPFVWITPGSIAGFSVAAMLATLLLDSSRNTRRWVIGLALLAGLLLTNFGPENPYFEVASRSWQRGRLLNFYGLALGLSSIWPVLALALLCWPRRLVKGSRAK